MTEFRANTYAYQFTNHDAPAYAREALEYGYLVTGYDIDDWAHETADGMHAVIYTHEALDLYAAGITSEEDDDAIIPQNTSSAAAIIDSLVTGLSFVWHKRILTEAAEAAIRNDEPDLWACITCFMAHAGSLDPDVLEEDQPAPWAHEDPTMYATPLRPLEPSFSWSACDACGSTLGGDRYPMRAIDRAAFA